METNRRNSTGDGAFDAPGISGSSAPFPGSKPFPIENIEVKTKGNNDEGNDLACPVWISIPSKSVKGLTKGPREDNSKVKMNEQQCKPEDRSEVQSAEGSSKYLTSRVGDDCSA